MSRAYHFDPKVLDARGGVWSDDDGNYRCGHCGCAWKAEDLRVYWPIAFRWNRRYSAWFKTHGWELGSDGIERRIYGWTLHLGRLQICFGRRLS